MTPFLEKNFYNSGSDLLYRHSGQDVYIGRFQSGKSLIGKPQAIRLLVDNYDVNSFIKRVGNSKTKCFTVFQCDGFI